MTMLESTKNTIKKLREAGFQRCEFSVTTPVTSRHNGKTYHNGWIKVDFKCSYERRLELALPLSEKMKTILHPSQGKFYSCHVEAAEHPGLFVWIDTKYIPVASMEEAERLARAEYEEIVKREEERQQQFLAWERARFNYQPYMEP